MWYIIKTETSTEDELERKFNDLHWINDTYLPRYRRRLPKNTDKVKYKYCLTIPGVIFVNVSKSNKEEFCKHLTDTGYLLDANSDKFNGMPHLLRTSSPRLSLDDLLELSKVTETDFNIFKIYNDQKDIERSMETLDLVDNVTYKTLQQDYDTVCVLDGPYSRYQGIVKREPNIVDGKKHGKDNRLFCQIGIWSVRISNIRKYNYIIVREAVNGKDFPLTNTWRFIDRILGSLQASFFPDNSAFALRTLLTYLKGKELDAAKHEIRKTALETEDSQEKQLASYLSTFVEEMDAGTQGSLTALTGYFKKVDELKEGDLKNLIPDIKLRPFLTPTPGKKLPKKYHYTVLKHNDFTEIILRLNLKSCFVNNIYVVPKGITLSNDDYIYYTHIGLKKNETVNGITAFVNWGGFIHSFMQREDDGKSNFVSLLKERNVASLADILEDKKEKVKLYDKSLSSAGFEIDIKDVDFDRTALLLDEHKKDITIPFGIIKQLHPIAELLRKTIPAAVEMWQSPRFNTERKLLQRFVLLHKIPVADNDKKK